MRKYGRHFSSGARRNIKKRKEKHGGTSMQRTMGSGVRTERNLLRQMIVEV